MRLLLDTQVVLWQLSGDRDISNAAKDAISDARELRFSAVSYAEIGVKVAVGKLDVPADLIDRVDELGLRTLPLSAEHGLAVADLPVHHRDPFDRLLIAQAVTERMVVVTADQRFHDYPVTMIDAS
ncbi:type II toxin-antitoxin system VapC family toxin [Microlunatus soli]|uniref:PIN domain nuclease, a component of toxin-antitoxin system (PIN domain) n=1 Tax=Microlunatus soli TaxID=630515 RepID=A0A1H1ZC94_9ACTN|nr:type II toxin-antitoxin system VapC family toxin [Microlunatus soli]SDT31122.1 PIN domain nuclease, a component of toxin-antitoxin system (PIN domain) [Microlunatus soli]